MSQRVTVFGAGYVGLVTGVCLAGAGHDVALTDVDREKLDSLRAGRCPFFEPGLEDLLAEARDAGRLTFSHPDDLQALDGIAVVAVGTPSTGTGSADLRYVRSVVDTMVERGVAGSVVVMKSTVPPGTGRKLAPKLSAAGIDYVSNPEFLREGSAVSDWNNTDRVVIGGPAQASERVAALYEGIDTEFVFCDVTSAEMIKYASNAFLATKISFINEIARLCDFVGADIEEVAVGVGLDKRIGQAFLNAGIGYGGSCFPKDARALDFLADMNGYDFQLLRAVIDVNTRQRILPVRTLIERLGDLEGRRVAVLGLTFKPDTDDTREAPAREIVDLLRTEGALVIGHNPIPVHSTYGDLEIAGTLESAIAGADAVIVATEWPEYVTSDWTALARTLKEGAIVFDGRNCLDPEAVRAGGALYCGVGRGAPGCYRG